MGSAVLLTAIRLVLHAHFEPYKDPVDNLFDYLTLTISFLTGLGGVLLQGLDTEKEVGGGWRVGHWGALGR